VSTLTLTVNEFMAIMGHLDEQMEKSGFKAESALYDSWYQQWREIDARIEKLSMMDRADMLFDGKVTIQDISEELLDEVRNAVSEQIAMHQKMIDENDVDADIEDLEIWQNRMSNLKSM